MDLVRLHELITRYFDFEELKTLCFSLSPRVDFDSLRGEGKSAKVRELIEYCERNGQLPNLYKEIIKCRPHLASEIPNSNDTNVTPSTSTENSQRESKNKTNNSAQPLSPEIYVVISAVSFLIGIGLLLFMVLYGPRLLQLGMAQQVFYILLLPLGMSTAAFVFGAMRSYAAFKHKSGYGTFYATGPIVVAALVVLGGFYLVPPSNSFDLTVRVNTPEGPLREGELFIVVEASTLSQPIDANGEAKFNTLPNSFRNREARISVWDIHGTRLKEELHQLDSDVIEIELDSAPPNLITDETSMGTGFNVAIARFNSLDPTFDQEKAADLSEWLYGTIERSLKDLPPALLVNLRGPKDLSPIKGATFDEREANACKTANKIDAHIFIYGSVSRKSEDESPELELGTCVSATGFDYGSEVDGPETFGKPTPFDESLTPDILFEVNRVLKGKTDALVNIVKGLGYFYLRNFEDAAESFQSAIDIDSWSDGKEIGYLLHGAAIWREYDLLTNIPPLLIAKADFAEATNINPEYGRGYLGLAAVTRSEAAKPNEEMTGIGEVDPTLLKEAENLYLTSMSLPDQSPLAYVTIKAKFGLGQTHFLGFSKSLPGWSDSTAESYFLEVIEAYKNDPKSDLGWYAAESYALIGLIHGLKGDSLGMSENVNDGLDILNELPGNSPSLQIARYWYWLAIAEKDLGNEEDAFCSFSNALEIGAEVASTKELNLWQRSLDNLGLTDVSCT